jgi:hypothetical protein
MNDNQWKWTEMKRLLMGLLILLCAASALADDKASKELPSIGKHTEGMQHSSGFFDLFWDAKTGKVLMQVAALDEPILYVTALPYGVGSNDLGLDRGQLSRSSVVEFRRMGPRVLLFEPNLAFRAVSDNQDEVRAVDQAFARSVLAGFDVVAVDPEAVLIDVTELLMSDAHGVSDRLASRKQGTYKIDGKRSAPVPESLKSFPQNTVMEAWITFAGDKPGDMIRSVTPTAKSVTVRMRHEFVKLPEAGFEMRPFHPRSGYFPLSYRDYAVPLGEAVEQRFLVRHRLEAGQPLVYYVDRGAPEPIRGALMDGVRWWAEAFDAAGFPGAFRVELLPEGADPLDVRFNVVQWVHRSTRGWSYGASVRDPRTGEIIKGHISLGSLRVRQDMLIAEGLLAPFDTGVEAAPEVQAMALARLRQLAAHEVGHTLGLAHNFAASVNADASVMDYPHPFVRLDADGKIQVDESYSTGIGEWDKLAIAYGYRQFDSIAARDRGLADILAQAEQQGLRFISDPDARGIRSAHAVGHLWDNGADPLDRLEQLTQIRARALERFSEKALRANRPMIELERTLVPVYFVHRYQAEAVAKLLAGLDYDYALRGDAKMTLDRVEASRQNAALAALIEAISEESLALPAELLQKLTPPAYGFARDREYFSHLTGAAFDAHAPARALTQLVVQMLLEPARAERLIQQHENDPAQPGLNRLLVELTEATLGSLNKRDATVLAQQRAWVVLRELQRLASDPAASDQVRALSMERLSEMRRKLSRGAGVVRQMAATIERFLEDPDPAKVPPRYPVPPGSPI